MKQLRLVDDPLLKRKQAKKKEEVRFDSGSEGSGRKSELSEPYKSELSEAKVVYEETPQKPTIISK